MVKKDNIDLGDDFDPEEDEEEEEETNEVEPVRKRKRKKEDFAWEHFSQVAFDGLRNPKTGEIISDREILLRILSFAEEAAKNTR